jgi:hypothetical protein
MDTQINFIGRGSTHPSPTSSSQHRQHLIVFYPALRTHQYEDTPQAFVLYWKKKTACQLKVLFSTKWFQYPFVPDSIKTLNSQ